MVTAQGRAWPSAHPTRLHHPHGQCRECREPLLKAWLISLLLRHCDPMDCNPSGTSVHGDSPGKNTGVGYHALLQGIFPTQGWNPGLPRCRPIVYRPGRQPPGQGSSSTRPLTSGLGHRAQAWWPLLPSQRGLSPPFKLTGFTYLFLAALSLRGFSRAFSSCNQHGMLFVAALRLLRVLVSLVEEHRL